MNFKIGMKVVCIKTATPYNSEICPIKGDVFTIRAIEVWEDGIRLKFDEIHNNPRFYYGKAARECGFLSVDFVPLLSDYKRITFERVLEMVETSSN